MSDQLKSQQRHWHQRAAILWIAVLLSACASVDRSNLVARDTYPTSTQIGDVPFIAQQNQYCGPASLAMALNWSGSTFTQEEVAKWTFTPGASGTFRNDLVAAARRNGRLAVEISSLDALLTELAEGHPVIVFQNLGLKIYPRWHYAVATGYDLKRNVIYLHSGRQENEPLNLKLFRRMWARGDNWALLVLPPDRLPASSDAWDVLQAATALERLGNVESTVSTYQAMTERWPDNWFAYFGLGNLHFAAQNYDSAVTAYRSALGVNNAAPEVWNNLAYAYLHKGEAANARRAARQAIVYAKDDPSIYRQTLEEIERSL